MAGLPNATYLGFTGAPVDKTAPGLKKMISVLSCLRIFSI